jgi:predicted HicB family RNase H-like nuclease
MARTPRKGDKISVMMPGGERQTFVYGGDIDLDKEVVLNEDGTRFTEADAQRVAEEAVERFRRRAGRPALDAATTAGTKSPQVSFRVPERLAERAEAVAAAKGKTLSQLGREALEKYLETAS